MIPNNSTGTGANDGNCPLDPGAFLSDPLQGPHAHRTVDMQANGIFQGYRWYALHGETPLSPFGHGLSYTRFSYANDRDAQRRRDDGRLRRHELGDGPRR